MRLSRKTPTFLSPNLHHACFPFFKSRNFFHFLDASLKLLFFRNEHIFFRATISLTMELARSWKIDKIGKSGVDVFLCSCARNLFYTCCPTWKKLQGFENWICRITTIFRNYISCSLHNSFENNGAYSGIEIPFQPCCQSKHTEIVKTKYSITMFIIDVIVFLLIICNE